MKNERIKKLRNELKYLLDTEIEQEIIENDLKLNTEEVDIKELAKSIYLKRGLDIKKIKKNFFGDLVDSITEMGTLFKEKNKSTKRKMIVELIYIGILLLLIKIPFDLVRDIGYEYIEIITTKTIYFNLWNILFLIIYTITILCTLIVFIRNFINKYKNTSN